MINGDDKTEECVSDVGYSLVVNEHLDIIAKFAIDSYSLNYSCNEEFGKMIVQKSNGDDVISGDLIPYNEKVTFTLQPAVRCYVASVMIDGEEKMDEILTNKSFSLNITKETTVQVVYEAEKYSLTLANDTPKKGKLMVKRLSDDIELEDQSEIIYDEELLIAWLPEEGCELAELWIKEGEDDEYDFLAYLGKVKNEQEFEMKSFVLALYYRSKKDFNQARHYYDVYLTSKHVNNDIGVIMDSVWSGKAKSELVAESVKKFEN